MKFYQMLFVAMILQQVVVGLAAELDESQQTPHAVIAVTIPADFPVGLATIIPGRLDRSILNSSVLQLTNREHKPTASYAQKEIATGQVWLFIQIDQEACRGMTLTFQARPCNGHRVVTIEERKDGFQFLDEGREVMFYQKAPKSDDGQHTAANYVHPVWGLDGEVLTQDFPPDHRHHHGVFWAWHQLWVGEKRAGDPWVNKDFLPVVKRTEVIEEGPVFATLRTTVDWTSPLIVDESGKPTSIVQETTQIRLFHATKDSQYIDFQISLRPLLEDVKIGGAENSRGYSGFTVRVKPPDDMKIVDAKGPLSEDRIGTASAWADVSGRYGKNDALSGIAILSHPSLPEFPPRWLLRYYGMQNVVYPGREPITLSRKRPLVLRHRLVVHRGDAHTARIQDHQTAFQSSAAGKAATANSD